MRALGFTFLQRLVAQDSTFKPNLYSGAIVGTQAQRDLVPSSTADHETQTLWRSILWVVDTPIANGKYEVFEYTGTWVKRFECTLLEISEGVSSAVTKIFSAVSQARGNGSPITNNVPPVDGMLYIDNLTRNLWCYAQGSWAPAHSLGDIVSIPDYRTPDNYPAGAVVRGDTDLGFTIDGIYRKDQPSTGTLWIRVGGAYPSPESIPAIQFGHIYAPGIPFHNWCVYGYRYCSSLFRVFSRPYSVTGSRRCNNV